MRRVLVFPIVLLALAATLSAQTSSFCGAHASKLYCQLPSLFGNAAVNPLEPLNQALATQLTLVPLASPASGLVYTLDPSLKIPKLSGTESFGPVLTERGETLYHGKLFLASTYQRFRFDSLDGVNFKKIPMAFEFCDAAGQCGLIGTIVRVDAHLDQYAVFGTYGVTNWLDVSAAIPFAHVSMGAEGVSCVQPYCSFTTPGGTTVSFQSASVDGSSSGVGDVTLRVKASPFHFEKFKAAAGVDVRLPSGDALNFLGAGGTGVKPFVAFSRSGKVSPHVNLAYQWNSTSLLAGSVEGEKASMPSNFSYIGGFDAGVLKTLTISADYLGERVANASRLTILPVSDISSASQAEGTFNAVRGAFGLKWLPWHDLLVTANVLQKFDHSGLHHTAVPLFGISYTFHTGIDRD